jgi:hypothetical protein
MMQSCAILLSCLGHEPFLCPAYLYILPITLLLAISAIRLAVMVLQCSCPSDFYLFNDGPKVHAGNFITVCCHNCCILLLAVNLLVCLHYKLDFIIGMYVQKKP